MEFQRTMLAMRMIAGRDLFQANYEIDFIKYLWGELNEELYGYNDHDLSLRFRGIDRFAPICNTDIAFLDEEIEAYDIDDLPFED